MNTAIAVQLSVDAVRRLHELAAQSGRSQAEYISEAVLEHLADEEAFRVAEQRMQNLENGRSDALTLDEVIRDSHVR